MTETRGRLLRAVTRLGGAVFGVLALCCLTAPTLAGAFPEKPIQMVVPYKPGGGNDISARIVSDHLKGILSQPVVITNIDGAAGGLGAMSVIKAHPDGYTLLWEHPTVGPLINKANYSWRSFDPVCVIAASPLALIVRGDSPFKTAAEALAAIKAEPGKYRWPMALNGITQFIYFYINDLMDLSPHIYPQYSDKGRITDLMGNNADIALVAYSAAVPYQKSGDIRILAVMSEMRLEFAPEIPTLKEQGIDAVYEMRYAVFATKGTPPDVIKTLSGAFKKVLADPATQKALREQFFVPLYRDAPETVKLWAEEEAKNIQVGKKHGLIKE